MLGTSCAHVFSLVVGRRAPGRACPCHCWVSSTTPRLSEDLLDRPLHHRFLLLCLRQGLCLPITEVDELVGELPRTCS